MSELRQDPTTGEWVVIAYERASRRGAFHRPPEPPRAASGRACPFCPGAEDDTPQELERLRLPHSPQAWDVRVVPNRYPALTPLPQAAAAPPGDTHFTRRAGYGHHEVIVETPRHGERFADLDLPQAALVLRAWQRRYRALAAQEGIRAVVVFKNHGVQAGASLDHAHSQAVAVPVVPQRIAFKERMALRHATTTGGSLYADLLADERRAASRIVLERAGLIALAPFAARWPYETWVLPDDLDTPFEALDDAALVAVAETSLALLRALRHVEGELAFNLLLCTPSLACDSAARYPWHLELVPRAVQPGGFELSTDLPINPIPPEQSAQRLRDALAGIG